MIEKVNDMLNSTYVLNVGAGDQERLAISHAIYGVGSQQWLRQHALPANATILDVGCGSGNMSLWLAQQIVPQGRVTAVDSSVEQLAIAKKRAVAAGVTNIRFLHCSAQQLSHLDEYYAAVYCRFLLIHVPEPETVLAQMADRLQPGGILLCEEPITTTHACYPANISFDRANQLTIQLGHYRGVDYNLGERLQGLFTHLNWLEVSQHFFQPEINEPWQKRIFSMSFNQIQTQLQAVGLITAHQADHIADDLEKLVENHHYKMCGFKVSQVSGIKHEQ